MKSLLNKNGISYESSSKQLSHQYSNKIDPLIINNETIIKFFSYFRGRKDVYARAYTNKTTGKISYFTQCNNFWKSGVCPKKNRVQIKCMDCENNSWKQLKINDIVQHICGAKEDCSDVIGIYPCLPNGTCSFIVFDFDNHSEMEETLDEGWKNEIDTLRAICKLEDIPMIVERSRSGRGAHLWVFFSVPIEIKTARLFGYSLIEKGKDIINIKDFSFYDRLIPMQDYFKDSELGNLIALPLQGKARKDGNSVFVDENWIPFNNQFDALFSTRKLEKIEVESYIRKWNHKSDNGNLWNNLNDTTKPWDRNCFFNQKDVKGTMKITVSNRVYIETSNLEPRIQNQLRRLAAFPNPSFYKKTAMKLSTYSEPRYVYLGEDDSGLICLPRALLDTIKKKCDEASVMYLIDDKTTVGTHINVNFNGTLTSNQEKAVNALNENDNGILSASTAFGKTVVGTNLITKKKVSTLILLESTSLIEQWQNAIAKFIHIDEELPFYSTPSGKIKKRDSHIGIIHGAKDSSNGLIDIAMVGSLIKKNEFHHRLKDYGMVIVDECHHGASETMMKVLQHISAKYVYGVTATPFRSDGLEKINFMLLGPIRYKFTAKDRAQEQGIQHYVIPRFTRVIYPHGKEKLHINKAYEILENDDTRNELICDDVSECINNERTPIVLTKYTKHAKELFNRLHSKCNNVFLLIGEIPLKKRNEIIRHMKSISNDEQLILIATNQLVGEGFDFPRLDTLIMATPVAWKGVVEQLVGRLNRDYPNKKDVVVYDYIDSNIPVFDRMYFKRLKAYKQIGYELFSTFQNKIEIDNYIYGYDNYIFRYEKDIMSANKEIIVSSPSIQKQKIIQFLIWSKQLLGKGVKITIITEYPGNNLIMNDIENIQLFEQIRNNGIHIELSEEELQHYTIIDRSIVWYGSINFLGKDDINDNIMRIISEHLADELLEITFNKKRRVVDYKLPL